MRKFTVLFLVLIGSGLVSGCTQPDAYPVTGEQCGPEDPAKTMDGRVSECMPPSV
jgi:hypothetical protein